MFVSPLLLDRAGEVANPITAISSAARTNLWLKASNQATQTEVHRMADLPPPLSEAHIPIRARILAAPLPLAIPLVPADDPEKDSDQGTGAHEVAQVGHVRPKVDAQPTDKGEDPSADGGTGEDTGQEGLDEGLRRGPWAGSIGLVRALPPKTLRMLGCIPPTDAGSPTHPTPDNKASQETCDPVSSLLSGRGQGTQAPITAVLGPLIGFLEGGFADYGLLVNGDYGEKGEPDFTDVFRPLDAIRH